MTTKAEQVEAAAQAERGEDQIPALDKAKKVENLVDMAQTEEHHRRVMELDRKDVKIPADLSKISNSHAKELVEAGLLSSADVPGRMYKRKLDGFSTRIPNFTFDAYSDELKAEWDEVKLTTDAPEASEPTAD